MRGIILTLFLLSLLPLCACAAPSAYTPAPPPPPPPPEPSFLIAEAEVRRVIDGDTVEVNMGGRLYKVRYIGIDTPELGQPGGEEARMLNYGLVAGRIIKLEKDVSETDRYGRLLHYVWFEDTMVNAALVALGYAQVATYPPDVKYQQEFLELQRQAREAGLGLWGAPAEPAPAPLPTPTPQPAPTPVAGGDVQITHIFYDGLVPRVESDEYVEITNLGDEPQDLIGWVLVDISEGYPQFVFPRYVLAPGESIRVYTNEIHPEYGGFSFGYGKAIWNNKTPDTAALYDAQGQEVSRKSY